MIEKAVEIIYSEEVGKDKFEAYILLTKAAWRKHPAAQYWLGRMHYEGLIVEKSYRLYNEYMGLSAGQGYLPAQLYLEAH